MPPSGSLVNETLAIIPARGGSKRIPGKNLRLFHGRPILLYSIEAALGAGVFSEVLVSTDSDEIAATAQRAGAKVPFRRSAKASDDVATTADVLLEVLNEYGRGGRRFAAFCCLYPTAPFVTSERLRHAMEQLSKDGVDSVIPVVRFSYPIQRALQIQDGLLSMIEPKFMSSRSQDLPPAYHDVGQFYCARTDAFLRSRTLFMPATRAIVVPEGEAQDIDTEEDWKLAELKYERLGR